jgi:hypothetical protein
MEGVEKKRNVVYKGMRSVVHNMAESISQYYSLAAITWYRLRWYMHNDVHKVTARNKWRC